MIRYILIALSIISIAFILTCFPEPETKVPVERSYDALVKKDTIRDSFPDEFKKHIPVIE